MHIAIDPGSTHMGKKKFIKELVEDARRANVSSLKFQLFPNKPEFTDCGNVWLDPDLFKVAYKQGKKERVLVTASVFGKEEAEFLADFDVPYVKFAYSMKDQFDLMRGFLNKGTKVVVTSDPMHVMKINDEFNDEKNLIKLYTATIHGQTLYPVNFEIDFDGLFTRNRFDGFSDHSLSEKQACNAVRQGAKWVEAHAGLLYREVECPDKAISWDIKRLHLYVNAVRSASK